MNTGPKLSTAASGRSNVGRSHRIPAAAHLHGHPGDVRAVSAVPPLGLKWGGTLHDGPDADWALGIRQPSTLGLINLIQ